MSHRALPARPDVEQYKKQAKELLKECATGSPEALGRIRQQHARALERSVRCKLADAQLVIAREHGFESWPQFALHLASRHNRGCIRVHEVELGYEVALPRTPRGLVLIAYVGSSGALHPNNRFLADALHHDGWGTMVVDLMTEDEDLADRESRALRYEVRRLGQRVVAITDWIGRQPHLRGLHLGYCASGTGASAALFASAERPEAVRAVVSQGGRPDLVGPWVHKVKAATLLIAGMRERATVFFNQSAEQWFAKSTPRRFELMASVEDAAGLQKCSELAVYWFGQYMKERV